VRHVRHGGVLAPLTRDLFVPPTRAPYELATSIRLRDAGVATPEVLAYGVYRAGPGLRRADVVTREIPDASMLAACVTSPAVRGDLSIDQQAVWHAVRVLIDALGRAGAFHADLNVTNVLITGAGGSTPTAYALDIDRVIWRRPGDPTVARDNAARLRRSAEKRRLV
jgi:tRNA A-37 threonylcarbamoyl transferase component Bud32